MYTYKGNNYKTLVALSRAVGIPNNYLKSLIQNSTPETLEHSIENFINEAIIFEGRKYTSVHSLASYLKLPPLIISKIVSESTVLNLEFNIVHFIKTTSIEEINKMEKQLLEELQASLEETKLKDETVEVVPEYTAFKSEVPLKGNQVAVYGTVFPNSKAVSVAYGIAYTLFRHYIRQGKTSEEALDLCLQEKYTRNEIMKHFPMTYNGKVLQTLDDFYKYTKLGKHVVEKYIEKGIYNPLHMLNDYRIQMTAITGASDYIPEVEELYAYLDLNKATLKRLSSEAGGVQSFLQKLKDEPLYLHGQPLSTVQQYISLTRVKDSATLKKIKTALYSFKYTTEYRQMLFDKAHRAYMRKFKIKKG